MDTDNIIMDIDELCVYLNMPKSTIYKLTQEGRIPSQKVGRRWRFHREVIDRWLADLGPYHVKNSDIESSIENGKPNETTDSSMESVHLTSSVNIMGLTKTPGLRRVAGAAGLAGFMKSSGAAPTNSILKSGVSVLSEAPFVFFEKKQQEILKRSSISCIGALLVLLATDQGKNQLTDLLTISQKELDQIAMRITKYINSAQEK